MRALTGTGRISSGYLMVKGVRKRVRKVTIIPLAIPVPNKAPPFQIRASLQGEFYSGGLLYYKGLVKEITQSVPVQRYVAQASSVRQPYVW